MAKQTGDEQNCQVALLHVRLLKRDARFSQFFRLHVNADHKLHRQASSVLSSGEM